MLSKHCGVLRQALSPRARPAAAASSQGEPHPSPLPTPLPGWGGHAARVKVSTQPAPQRPPLHLGEGPARRRQGQGALSMESGLAPIPPGQLSPEAPTVAVCGLRARKLLYFNATVNWSFLLPYCFLILLIFF